MMRQSLYRLLEHWTMRNAPGQNGIEPGEMPARTFFWAREIYFFFFFSIGSRYDRTRSLPVTCEGAPCSAFQTHDLQQPR
jgi:hypothetical protein